MSRTALPIRAIRKAANLSRVRVMLVDDHAIWRGGVRAMLDDTEFVIVGEASNGCAAIETARWCRPDIVLLDVRMSVCDGFAALTGIASVDPRIAVIMLTTYDDPTYMARAAAGGAVGYLAKGISREELLAGMRAIAAGQTLLTPKTLLLALKHISDSASNSHDLFAPLTERETEVLRLLSTGLSNREIASLLFITEGTAKTHVEHIIRKLFVSDRVQAAVWAVRQGMGEDAGQLSSGG